MARNGPGEDIGPDVTPKRTTLADVARHAGTSTAVVSYVLNDGPRPVSDRLRAKVLHALDELDYRPDHAARALRRVRRRRHLGLLVPDVRLPLFGTLVGQLEVQARERDHLTLLGNTGYDPEREIEFAAAFTDSGIDGLIVVGGANGAATAALCRQARIPIVWVHNNRDHVESQVVGADHLDAGRLATTHLTQVHHRENIAFVGGFTAADVQHGDRETVAQRYAGYLEVVGESAARHIPTDLTPSGAYHAMRHHLSTQPPLDALVVGTYAQAAATVRAVTDAGLRIPQDISLVGYDADPTGTYTQLTLTTVQQPIATIARAALSRILDTTPRTSDTPIPPIDIHLTIGESCGCTSAHPVSLAPANT
ncbi:LacI family DNA-binding transcriptional regulator [Nocardia macrotermitis]|uniref:HTH-type transcriptional repressor PurR n=1 Tax=Nocardia macrotermitis TaxID=2585198 RepID=A0A7K0CUI5_9NOCA|nr:LacI family DNA-binding transcriptional regulator [Nocardia macrotermitis]MQY17043.1 HTH-type transcriptional repressor PurR [Nocardia macrotermitis]